MAESRDFAGAAVDASMAYAQYLLRTSANSVRTLQLFDQVIGCVARHQLTPDTLARSLASFIESQRVSSERDAQTIAARFVTGLASSTALQSYQSRIDEIATGGVTRDASRRGARKEINRATAHELSRTTALWFDLLGDLDDARARSINAFLLHALREAHPLGFDADVVDLTGSMNATASTVVSLENTRTESVTVRCAASSVRRADGIGPAFAANVVITPDELVVDGGDVGDIRLSLDIDSAVFEPGARYVGIFHIDRDGAPRVDVPLRITPTPSAHA